MATNKKMAQIVARWDRECSRQCDTEHRMSVLLQSLVGMKVRFMVPPMNWHSLGLVLDSAGNNRLKVRNLSTGVERWIYMNHVVD